MQTWATFSIIDHRKPVYRQALALFDKIVVPIPPMPIGDQTSEELEQLKCEVDYLAEHQAAEQYEWSSEAFVEWRKPFLAEAVAVGINRDAFHDTRLMLVEQLGRDDVQAVPVYGGSAEYEGSKKDLIHVEEVLTMEIMQRLPVPDYDTPLPNLIDLRKKPAFRQALEDLLEWKQQRIPAIVLTDKRPEAIAAAMRDFDKLTKAYAEAMESEGHKKAIGIGSIFFSAVTGGIVDVIKEGLVSFKEYKEPCWKKVSQMKCAPGGVVYHFEHALK